MTRLVIERLRILGLHGHAPTRTEVEVAVRRALTRTDPHQASSASRLRIEGGRTLADAAEALAAAVDKHRGQR